MVKALTSVTGGAAPIVVHLWGLDAEKRPVGDLDASTVCAIGPLLHLLRAAKRLLPDSGAQFWLVTRGAQPATHDAVDVRQAPLWGAGVVLGEEHHELWGGLIDLDPDGAPAANASHITRQIVAADGEDQVCFRDGERFVRRLVRLSTQVTQSRPIVLRSDAAYLITGAFGGVGREVAQWLVREGARRLVLIGRSPLPPRSEWESLDPTTDAADRVRAVKALEAMGAAVHTLAVDVADRLRLKGALDRYRSEEWPPIRGVVHCAAIIEDRILTDLDTDSVRRVAAPKAMGAWNLHEYFEDAPLDCFILFSSSGAFLGAMGQGSYAAANAFLDALAHARRSRSLPALSINWGFWQGLGFAATSGGRRLIDHMKGAGLLTFSSDQAVDALSRVLAGPTGATAAILKIDWQRARAAQAAGETASPLLRDLMPEKRSTATQADEQMACVMGQASDRA